MPAAFGANGKVQLAWYDTRRELEDPNYPRIDLPLVADYELLSNLVQRKVDVFTTNITLTPGPTEQDPPVLYIPEPIRASQFSIVVDEHGDRYESEASFANKKLFAQGSAPFLGDYIAIAARQFREITSGQYAGKWMSNAFYSGGQEDFFAAWTSNRDVTGEIPGIGAPSGYTKPADAPTSTGSLDDEEAADEMIEKIMLANNQPIPETGPPRDSAMISEGLDGSDPDALPAQCEFDPDGEPLPVTNERNRDSNIYGSLIKDQLRLYAPTPAKPLTGVVRAFVVALSNSDINPRTYDLQIIDGNCYAGACKASFRQNPSTPPYSTVDNPVVDSETVTVPAKSTLARTVFIAGNQDPVIVQASEGGSPISTIRLGNAPFFEDPENCPELPTGPDPSCTVSSNELHNLELKTIDVYLLDLLTPGDELDANTVLGDASSLVLWATGGIAGSIVGDQGIPPCCGDEESPSVGSVIEFAYENLANETVNIQDPSDLLADAALLNAALLNAALLNANLLNASLLNASLLNANDVNASLLNYSPDNETYDPKYDYGLIGGTDGDLYTQAVGGGCCLPEGDKPTIGNIVVWAYFNLYLQDPETNASLLNAALLNANLLNANLLNASLLNASLLNASLLNASLLNASLLNAALLNPSVDAASLLNADLLNADLLNASLLNPTLVALAEEGGCCEGTEEPTAVDVIIYAVGHPDIINASLLNAALLNAALLNANLLNANLLNANLLNADLLNANLLNADLLNASLLNADLLNADLLNASLLNSAYYDDTSGAVTGPVVNPDTGEVTQSGDAIVTFDDYTYPITNNGNVTTAIDTDITINAPLGVIGTKLIIWTTNATPTVVNCEERVQLDTRVQTITAPDVDFDTADIKNPFAGQASAVVAPGETVFVTLRVAGTKEQLKKVRVSGFTTSSQAANCTAAGCADALNDGVEQITFAPPVITLMQS
jgi:uncharacterized protein YjbI with pentapeptide repeats